jgi:hypothetical protein
MAALSCFPVAIGPLRFSRRIPPIKHIRRGVASRVALILEVDRTFAAGFQRLGQKDGLAGTYILEFRTDGGDSLAISVPRAKPRC